MSEAEQLDFIREQEQRISAMMGDRPAKLNDEALRAIKSYVDRYVCARCEAEVKRLKRSRRSYSRAPQYVPLIARSFQARKVPVIIGIYLPVIESAYRQCFENQFRVERAVSVPAADRESIMAFRAMRCATWKR